MSDSNAGNPSYEEVALADGSSYWRPIAPKPNGVVSNTGAALSYEALSEQLGVIVASSLPITQTTTVTSSEIFEIATPVVEVGMGLVTVLGELVAVDGDGETFGDDPGDICVEVVPETSDDGETWTDGTGLVQYAAETAPAATLSTIGQRYAAMWLSSRYARLRWPLFVRDGGLYSGPNAPTFTLALKVSSFPFSLFAA